MRGEMININKAPTTLRTPQRCSQGLFLKERLKKMQGVCVVVVVVVVVLLFSAA